MTVGLDDEPGDDFQGSLTTLRTYDVSTRRSRQLRRRCHAILQEPRPNRWTSVRDAGPFRRVIVPTLGAAWCLAYLMEIVRWTAAIYE
jgi:hypothetical protein